MLLFISFKLYIKFFGERSENFFALMTSYDYLGLNEANFGQINFIFDKLIYVCVKCSQIQVGKLSEKYRLFINLKPSSWYGTLQCNLEAGFST